MIRTLLLLGALSAVGLTSWTSAPEPAPAPLPAWTDTIDAWEALCDSATAVGDGPVLKFPCAEGPGARRPPQLDSIVNGVGTLRVYRVTDYSNVSTHGSLRAGIDSADAWSDGKSCTVIVFPEGGNVFFDETSANADDMECVYVLGQTAQGEGVNIAGGGKLRARASQELYFGYLYQRRAGRFSGWIPGSSSEAMCSSGVYVEHLSNSWFARGTGHNLLTFSCGTESVPMAGELARDATLSRNLLFEPHVDHSTFIHTGGDTAEVGGISKVANVLIEGNFMASGGQRTPLIGNTDSIQSVNNVSYNVRNYNSTAGSSRGMNTRIDFLDSYVKPGPYTQGTAGDASIRRWVFMTWQIDSGDTTAVMAAGIRSEYNDYALGATPTTLFRGADRATACSTATDAYAGECAVDGDSIPEEVWINTSDTLALGPARAQITPAPLTDSLRDNLIQIAGNSRYLACDGQWTLRSDSVDTRARTEFQDSTGVTTSTDLGTDTTRSYGTPASGTACTDSDSDGLPNAYENLVTGSTTALAADSIANGLPAILWYGYGRDMDGALVGCDGTCSAEGGSGGISPTFGAVNRYVYFVAMQSIFGLSFPDSIPIGDIRIARENAAGDTAMVVTCTATGAPADSATVHARLTAWNLPTLNTAVAVRDYDPFPGVGC